MIQNIREITIGRDNTCDIFLDECCDRASRHHGSIFLDGTQLMFRDNSINGTIINNIKVSKRSVPINNGDIIMIAGMYQISWSQINSFFPSSQKSTVIDEQLITAETINLSKWNWGAFAIYPIWGFFNGCWWGILISVFLGYLFPIPNLIFGLYGTRWAWYNRKWNSQGDFLKSQLDWAVWGIIISCFALFLFVFVWIVLLFL